MKTDAIRRLMKLEQGSPPPGGPMPGLDQFGEVLLEEQAIDQTRYDELKRLANTKTARKRPLALLTVEELNVLEGLGDDHD